MINHDRLMNVELQMRASDLINKIGSRRLSIDQQEWSSDLINIYRIWKTVGDLGHWLRHINRGNEGRPIYFQRARSVVCESSVNLICEFLLEDSTASSSSPDVNCVIPLPTILTVIVVPLPSPIQLLLAGRCSTSHEAPRHNGYDTVPFFPAWTPRHSFPIAVATLGGDQSRAIWSFPYAGVGGHKFPLALNLRPKLLKVWKARREREMWGAKLLLLFSSPSW
jgi:hypothetical protein